MKKKLFALLLAAVLLLGMLPTAALAADGAAPTPTANEELTPSPTPEASEEPTPSPTPEASEEPTPSSTPKASEEPTPSPTPEASEEPTPSPSPAPGDDPADDGSEDKDVPLLLGAPAPEPKVRVIVQNKTFPEDEGAPWDGVLVDTWVTIDEDSSMMSCVVAALEGKGYSQTGAENNYISEINGLSEFDGGYMSGWMGTLNDFFTNQGFAAYTVADGTLVAGDEICISYTCSYGGDLGGSWENNDTTLSALTFSAGKLDPEFASDAYYYTLTVPADTTSVVVTPTATNKNFQVRTYKDTATPDEDGTEYKRTAAIPVEDGTKLYVICGYPEWPSMNSSDGGDTYVIEIRKEAESEPPAPQSVMVAFSAQKDGAYIVNPASFTVQDGIAEQYGFTVPAVDHGGAAIDGPVFLDLLVAAHATKYGTAFTKATAGNYLVISSSGWVSKAFGETATSSSFLINGQMPADDSQTGYMANEARLTSGDSAEYFFYQSEYYMDYYTAFTESEKAVYTGDDFTLTLKGYLVMNGMSGSYVEPQPVDGSNEETYIVFYLLKDDGSLGDELDAVLNASGEATFAFDTAGTYTITANGFVYDETMDDYCPIVAPSCTVTVVDPTVTVNVTISNAGAVAESKNGERIAHRALTVVGKNITVGDVLLAAHKAWHMDGADAFGTEESTYGAYITKFWGESTSAVGYCVNDVMSMGLTDPVSEGDTVTAYIYADKDTYSDAHAYFNAASVEAETGEGISLTLKKDTYGADYSVVPVPVANAVLTVDGADSANITNSRGIATIVFNTAGTYIVSARTQDGSVISAPVCVVTVTGETKGDGSVSGSGDPYARLTGLIVHTATNPNSTNVLLRNAADTAYNNEAALVFDPAVTEYELASVLDTNTQLRFRPTVASGAKVVLTYGGSTKDVTWKSGMSTWANCLTPGRTVLTLTVSAADKESTVYTLSLNVTPTLTGLTAGSDGVAYSLDKAFSAAKNEYTLTIPDSVETLELGAAPKNSTYTVTYNGAESGEIDVSDASLTKITVAVTADGVSNEYTLTLNRIKAGSAAFSITPEECADAAVTVKDASGQVIPADADGTFSGLFDTYTYTYTVSKYGYVPVAGSIPAEGGVIDVTLVKNAEGQFDEVSSEWNNFRNSDSNMGLTDAKTPTDAESSALLWSKKLGSGWTAAPSVQIIVDNALIVMSGTTLYKLDLATGEILAEGTMSASPSYGYTPPTYAAGMIFCPLGSGTVQAFNAKTLESVWVYKDPLGGQSLTPIAYSDGYVYTGFWNSETRAANFVAISVSDDDPTSTNESKIASWSVTRTGGYYWAGAVIVGNTLVVGGDDGASGTTGDTSISSFDKRTGALISTISLPGMGDQRSCISYEAATGKVYFTTKNGYLCTAKLDAETGVLSDLTAADNKAQSTSTPIAYNGKVYYAVGSGISTSGSSGSFVMADANTMQVLGSVDLKGYPQCSPLLSTAYEDQGWLYFYCTYNMTPGGITLIKVRTDAASAADMEVTELYDAKGFEQYCITSLICDKNGTIYYKNDSGNVFAFGTPTYGSVIRQIRDIGEVTEDSYLAIEAARNAYRALTVEDQTKVTNESALTAAENAYAKLIEEQIDAIGTVTLEKEEQIRKTAERFDLMNETMQGKVPNADKLRLARKTLSELKVAKAEELIEQIPTSVTNANKAETQEKIKAAKTYLQSLTEDEQAKVTNRNRIDLAEAAVKKLTASGSTKGLKLLGARAQGESVNAIIEAIRTLLHPANAADKLPADMANRTAAQEDAILDIARAYNALPDDSKLFVTNYGDFEPVLEKLGAAYHADKETGVSVDGLPWHIRLACVSLEEGSELLEAINPVFSGKGSAKSMYWVTLVDVLTGKSYKTEEPFTVRLPLEEAPAEGETAAAMYVSEDGKLRFLQGKDETEAAKAAEKTLVFETTETSCWYGAASIVGTWDDLMNGKILMEAGDELSNWLYWLGVTVKLVRTIVR